MSLSHLYPHLTNDLHINNATDLHQSFPWLRPVQAQFTTIRVLTPVLGRHALLSQSFSFRLRCSKAETRTAVKLPNPCFKTGASKMLTPRQVQALCTLCRRILFIVRSHYLYSIGLLTIFSLGWGIPPNLRQQSQATRLALWYHTCAPYIRGLNSVSLTVSRSIAGCAKVPQLHLHPLRDGLRYRALLSSIAFTERILVSFFSSA